MWSSFDSGAVVPYRVTLHLASAPKHCTQLDNSIEMHFHSRISMVTQGN
jgi:hypothetical protein